MERVALGEFSVIVWKRSVVESYLDESVPFAISRGQRAKAQFRLIVTYSFFNIIS